MGDNDFRAPLEAYEKELEERLTTAVRRLIPFHIRPDDAYAYGRVDTITQILEIIELVFKERK